MSLEFGIDLAMIPNGKIPVASVVKVTEAYGDSAWRDFQQVKPRLLDEHDYQRECMTAMAMETPQAERSSRLQRLKWPQ
jgi:hypothetical protein